MPVYIYPILSISQYQKSVVTAVCVGHIAVESEISIWRRCGAGSDFSVVQLFHAGQKVNLYEHEAISLPARRYIERALGIKEAELRSEPVEQYLVLTYFIYIHLDSMKYNP
ncbi:hypothetical protein NDU88_002900 [Pleurodeles waltl]|uniref:Uncharacterized protein n=1 Tax=Pleurodeles waltl TaxID=8319 RepID=A0AAV7VE70_PLEWA|nr:hypothetical protein NDU88_002900 [Pleurodeles waltl]